MSVQNKKESRFSRGRHGVTLGCLIAFGLCSPAYAEYPDKPITVLVGWGAGGGMDVFARTAAKHIKKYLGVEFNVVNKSGGGGKVAHNLLVTEYEPDGYTISAASVPHQSIPPQLSDDGYRVEDLRWISNMAVIPSAVVVDTKGTYESFSDLVAAAKASPGKLKSGSPGATSGAAAFHYRWTELAGIDIAFIPYQGGSKMFKGLLGGEIQVMSSNVNWSVRNPDQVNTLAVASKERYSLLPNVPTLRELGVDYVDYTTRTFVSSSEVPEDRIKILDEAFAKLSKDPDYIAEMAKIGQLAIHMNTAETTKFVNDYVKSNSKVFALMREKQGK